MSKYAQLAEWVRQQIQGGHIQYGEKLHTENELCALFGVSRQTVRMALRVLEQEGVIERRQGSGTYAAHPPSATVPSMRIGVISTYLDDYIFPGIIRGMEDVLRTHGYIMQLVSTQNRVENERALLLHFLREPVDGLIIEPTKSALPSPNAPLYAQLLQRKVPIVLFNAPLPGDGLPCVALDDEAAGFAATEYLLSMGHTRIAGLFQCDDMQGHLRYAGYARALLEAGAPLHAEHTLWYPTEDIPYLFENEQAILRRLRGVTAVLCYNDSIAVRLMRFLSRQSITVPGDLSIVSVDNAPLARYSNPPLTTVDHPKAALGARAAETLLRLLQNPQSGAGETFPAALQIRSSAAPPPPHPPIPDTSEKE